MARIAISQWGSDLAAAWRQVMRRPGANFLVIAILALGIGASGAMYAVLRPLLLNPLPYPEPERLVYIWETDVRNNEPYGGASYPDWVDWKQRARSFSAIAAYQRSSYSARTPGGPPERIAGLDASHEMFGVLGLAPALGRTFDARDDAVGAAPVALLGHAYWQRQFGGDPGVVGRDIELDGRTHQVVGVLPPAEGWALRADIWRPMVPSLGQFREERGVHGLRTIARLAPGVTREAAHAEMVGIAAALEQTYEDNKGRGASVVGMHGFFVRDVSRPLWLMCATVGLLLLLTCSNAAGLLLARATEREAELALRSSLGAGRGRLVRLLLLETMALGLVGGALGVALCALSLRLLSASNPMELDASAWRVDLPVLGFAVGVCLLASLCAGVLPGWLSAQVSPARALASGARGSAGSSARAGRVRQALVSLQVAVSLCMLLATAALVRSYATLADVQVGLAAGGVASVPIKLPASKYPMPPLSKYPEWPEVLAFDRRLVDELSSVPGVRSVAFGMQGPLDPGWTTQVDVEGRERPANAPPDEWVMRAVTPGYFGTLGIPLVRGRDLAETDRFDAPSVVVINEAAARKYFADTDPIGKRIVFWGKPREVIGVAGDVHAEGIAEPVPPTIHPSLWQLPFGDVTAVARVEGDPGAAVSALQQAVWRAEADAVPYQAGALSTVADRLLAPQRFALGIAAMLVLVAVALAFSGIAGAVGFEVARRRGEIGVRVALGARAHRICTLLARRSLMLVGAGAALGLAAYLTLAPLLQAHLYQVSARDPQALAFALMLMLVVVLAASLIPAARALRIEPMDVLRDG